MENKTWRTPKPHRPMMGQKVDPYPATRFFDQLSFIGNANVGCFVLETEDGLIQLDCMEPLEEHKQIILQGYKDLGLDPANLKAILVTHGHGDHYGCADYFRDTYGCKVYMSHVDYEYARQDASGPMGALSWEITDFLEDGDVFRLGSAEIHCYSTPGHTPGGLSFIFNVTDEGRAHTVGMWGGTGIPQLMERKVQYLESTLYFAECTEAMGCDAEISTHPFVDNGIHRLEVLRTATDGVPNPFVLGKENYKYYENMFTKMCFKAMHEHAKKLDVLAPPPVRR